MKTWRSLVGCSLFGALAFGIVAPTGAQPQTSGVQAAYTAWQADATAALSRHDAQLLLELLARVRQPIHAAFLRKDAGTVVAYLAEKRLIDRELGRSHDEVQDDYQLGFELTVLGRMSEAQACLQAGLRIDPDSVDAAMLLTQLDLIAMQAGRWRDARDGERRRLLIDKKLGRTFEIVNDLNSITAADGPLQDPVDKKQTCEELLGISLRLLSLPAKERGQVLLDVADCKGELGDLEGALRDNESAIASLSTLHDPNDLHHAELSRGLLLFTTGRAEESRENDRKLLDELNAAPSTNPSFDENLRENALGEIVLADIQSVRYDDAASEARYLLAVAKKSGNSMLERSALGDLADIASLTDRYDEAQSYSEQAVAVSRRRNDLAGETAGLVTLAGIFRETGRSDEALATYEKIRALSLARGLNGDFVLPSIAMIETYDRHDFIGAIRTLNEVNDRDRKNDPLKKMALYQIAINQIILRRYADAGRTFQAFLALRSPEIDMGRYLGYSATVKTGSNFALTDLFSTAVAESYLDRRDAALADFDRVVSALEVERGNFSDGDVAERTAVFSDDNVMYRTYISYLGDLNRTYPHAGYDRKAFDVYEMMAARTLTQQIGAGRSRAFPDVPVSVIDEGTRLDAQLAAIRANAPHDADPEPRLRALEAQEQAFQAGIRERYPAYHRLRYPQPITLVALQRDVLAPDELLLMYNFSFLKKPIVIAVDRESIAIVQLPETLKHVHANTTTLRSRLDALRAAVANQSEDAVSRLAQADVPDFAAESHRLYNQLIPPALRRMLAAKRRLLIVPSSDLHDVPWEALVATGGRSAHPRYLVEDHVVSYLSSASLLGVIRANAPASLGSQRPLLVLAAPAIDAPGLAQAQAEATVVQQTFGAADDDVLIGTRATKARLFALQRDGDLKDYRYLLFATHATLRRATDGAISPELLLSDGALTTDDILQLGLRASFVSLSACDTGAGTWAEEDGVNKLSTAFLYAGTPALSVALWPILDASATEMDASFFRRLRSGVSPAQALQTAKLEMIDSPTPWKRHPFAWAPTIVFGDGAATPR